MDNPNALAGPWKSTVTTWTRSSPNGPLGLVVLDKDRHFAWAALPRGAVDLFSPTCGLADSLEEAEREVDRVLTDAGVVL